ncbi:MAG: efflux RND transporter periplasmic adaptor subunit [Phycisphaerae bacterium]
MIIGKNWVTVGVSLMVAVQPVPAQRPASKVVVAQAKLVQAPATITLVGTVHAVRVSRVGSPMAGIVADMPIRQGDFVNSGDLLCKLNDDTIRHQWEESKAGLSALEARHRELVAGTRPEDLRRLKALVDEAEADLVRWKAEMERVTKLYEGASSNAKEVYDTRADYQRAERRKIAADAAYQLGVQGPRKEVIERAAFDVAAQQAVVDRLKSELDKTAIHAPFSGFVASRSAELGEWLAVGGTVVDLVDLSSVLVRVDAPESVFPFVHVSDAAAVHVDAVKQNIAGTVKHILRQADASARTFPIEISLPNEAHHLAAGMFARVTMPSGEAQPMVAVPKDAIVEKNGTTHVAITMPDRHGGQSGMLMPVTTGGEAGDWIAITSGNVHPGMSVITRGNERMLPFPQAIVIVDEHGTPIAVSAPERAPQAPAQPGRRSEDAGSKGGA